MTPAFPSDVEVVIVAHNNLPALPGVFEAMLATGCPPRDITLVDVASTDGTGAWLAAAHPEVRHRRLSANDGPNPGRNLGITEATRPFVLVMDADVLVEPETVPRLHAAMQADPRVRLGSPIVVHDSRPDTIQYAGATIHYICEAINPWVNRTLAERGGATLDIGAAPACALLIERQAALEVGLFDERYFLGKEDGDFVHRLRIAGYIVREVPAAIVRHHSRPRGTWLFYYQIRNRWHFMLKNYQLRTLLLASPALLVQEVLQFGVLVVKGHGKTWARAVKGIAQMLPSLGHDRAQVRRFRRVNDASLLRSGHLLVREDLASSGFARTGQRIYEACLTGYWSLLTSTVLRG